MSGRRCKALREAFFKMRGRGPYRSHHTVARDRWWRVRWLETSTTSEWRRLKRAWRRLRDVGAAVAATS